MKMLPVAFAIFLSFAYISDAYGMDICDFESSFDLRIEPAGLVFHRDSGVPAKVEMRAGRLVVDGHELALSTIDHERVRRYEDSIRALEPKVREVALDAVAIATDAVAKVASSFGGQDSIAVVTRARAIGAKLQLRIEDANDSGVWDEVEFKREVDRLTAEMVPMLVGHMTMVAMQAALNGDEAAADELEARVAKMKQEIDAKIERRADELEARVEALCPRVAEIDALESSLDLRLADNRPLDLLQHDP